MLLPTCASPPPRPGHAAAPSPPATRAATDAELDAACGDLAAFGALALRSASAADRPALERWSPPAPVREADRATVAAVLRRWVERCAREPILDLAMRLIRLPTVATEQSPSDGAAFRAMAELLARWAAESGLSFRAVGANDAWEVALGQGPRSVAYIMHADVVPAAEPAAGGATTPPVASLPPGWTVPPFEPTVRDGRLWGRGAEDDKGPIAAVLVVLSVLARAGLAPHGQVLAVMGTAEEDDWAGMRRYADAEPHARFVVSLDASFPVVIAESGFVAFRLAAPLPRPVRGRTGGRAPGGGTKASVVDARGGNFLTQVPGDARLVLAPGAGESTTELFLRAAVAASGESARGRHFGASAEASADGYHVVVHATGAAVHSSQADVGDNALWALASVASRLDLEQSGITDLLRVVHDKLDGDHWGERLGLAHEHPLMGRLLVTPTMLRVEQSPSPAAPRRAVLSINMRRPAGLTAAEFGAKIDAVVAMLRREVSPRLQEAGERYVGEPHIADTSGPLVDTLLDVYRAHTGQTDARPISIRGGTYARLFPGAVSFGPELPGRPYRGHAPDEWMEVDTLALYARMILDATLRLDAFVTTGP
jgi:predicted dipeptidase